MHRKFTGVSNELIISNLDMLLEEGKDDDDKDACHPRGVGRQCLL